MTTAPQLDRLGEGVEAKASDAERRSSFRPDIEGLRGIAVLLVVVYHAGVIGFGGGYVGVDVFFVISGYLITGHLLRPSTAPLASSLYTFYARRVQRLMPSALLVLVATLLAAWLWGPPLQLAQTAEEALGVVTLSVNYVFAAAGFNYLHADAAPSPLLHFWSLAVEEQFYLLWPVIILVALKVGRRRDRSPRRWPVISAIALLSGASLVTSALLTAINGPFAYYALQTRAWEFGLGGLTAASAPLLARVGPRVARWLATTGLASIAYCTVFFTNQTPFPGLIALVPVLATVLVVGLGAQAASGGLPKRVLTGKVIRFLGWVSYTWYLWHWPVLLLAPRIFDRPFGPLDRIAMIIVSLWLAILTSLLIEKPLLRSIISRFAWFKVGAACLTAASVLAGGLILLPAAASARSAESASRAVSALASSSGLAHNIRQAVARTSVPQDVQPALDAAADDVPQTTKDECHLGFAETSSPACTYGDPSGSSTMVLFGDSHAEQWFPAVNAIAKRAGMRLVSLTKSACPVADVVLYNEQIDRKYTECDTWRQDALRRIDALQPKLVIASQADTLPGGSYASADWASETRSTLRSVSKFASNVVFLADTPRPLTDIPACLADNSTAVSKCAIPAYEKMNPSRGFGYLVNRRAVVRQEVSTVRGVTYIDPTSWFCTDSTCPPIVGNVLVYRDASHVSATYARALRPTLETSIPRRALASK